MYHIKEDPRSIRSAKVIGQALLTCLETTEFSKITITAVQQTAGIGRATFYRIFDNLNDVLLYLSDEVYRQITEQIQRDQIISVRKAHLVYLRTWMENAKLLDTVIRHGGIRPFSTQQPDRNRQLFSALYPQLSDQELDYFVPISINSLIIALKTWIERGKQETPEQLLSIITNSYTYVLRHMTSE